MIQQIEATERGKANFIVFPEMTLASHQEMDGFGLYASSREKTQRGLWNLEVRGQSSFSAALNGRRLTPRGRRSPGAKSGVHGQAWRPNDGEFEAGRRCRYDWSITRKTRVGRLLRM